MHHPHVTRLYKYTTCSQQSFHNLANNIVYYCPPHRFNDPFDCAVRPSLSVVSIDQLIDATVPVFQQVHGLTESEARVRLQSIRHAPRSEIDDMIQRLGNELARRYTHDLGVFCMSEKNDDILMWAHYADQHTGFCLMFDRRKGGFFQDAGKVEYVDTYPDWDFFAHSRDMGQLSERVLLTKAKCWQYEAEWRYVSNADTYEQYENHDLLGIIFGLRTSDAGKLRIRDLLADRPHVQFFQATIVDHNFSLALSPVP